MKKKTLAAFLSICMLAAVAAPTALLSVNATEGNNSESSSSSSSSSEESSSSSSATEEKPESNSSSSESSSSSSSSSEDNSSSSSSSESSSSSSSSSEDNSSSSSSSSQPEAATAVTLKKSDDTTSTYATLKEAIDAADENSTITLNEDLTVTERVDINKKLTIEGNNHTITGSENYTATEPVTPAVVLISEAKDSVTLNNLKIVGGSKNKFPLNMYKSTGVTLNNVSVTNKFTAGGAINVNGSSVTVTGTLTVSTVTGSWYGIDVDSGTNVSETPSLTFADGSKMVYTNTGDQNTYDPTGPCAICVDRPTTHPDAVTGYAAAGLAEPTQKEVANKETQNLFFMAQSITLDQTTVTLKVGATAQLTATVTPSNLTNKTVTYTSDNTGVATVDTNGQITAVAAGTATITATINDVSATCTVTVEEEETPSTPETPETPSTPETPDTPSTPETPSNPTTDVVTNPTLDTPTVDGDTTNINAAVDAGQGELDAATATNPVNLSVNLPTESLAQAIANSTTSNVNVNVKLPTQAITNPNVKTAAISLGQAAFAQAKASGKTLTLNVTDQNGNTLYAWTFNGTDITDTTLDVNLALTVTSSDQDATIKNALSSATGTVLNFAHNGNLPAKASVKVDVRNYFSAGETAYLYYFNPTTQKMESIGNYTVDENGFITVAITHCSQYVLTKTQLTSANDAITPATGDHTNITISIAAVGAVGAAITGFIVTRKRRTNNN